MPSESNNRVTESEADDDEQTFDYEEARERLDRIRRKRISQTFNVTGYAVLFVGFLLWIFLPNNTTNNIILVGTITSGIVFLWLSVYLKVEGEEPS